jgi:tetratricopeptide (TPR) repeat protein
MDEASADLFAHLAAAAPASSWLTVVSRRPGATGFVAPEDVASRLELGPLSPADARELATAVSAGATLTAHQIDAVVDRSGGNPLFLRELVAATVGGGHVDELPDTIDDVVAARIDSLSTDDRFLLRRLAVLGQSFSVDLARGVLDDLPHSSDPAWRRLDEFLTRDDEGAVGFRNVLLRDSAYDGLSFRQRRAIHNRAGDTIRKTTWDGGDTQPEILSFHYLNGQRWDEAWDYSLMAAERAKAVYANFEAADFYQQAIVAGRRSGNRLDEELARAHEELGDARSRTGSYAPAAVAYRAARQFVRSDPVGEARIVMKLARVQGWLDRYATALRWITKGLRLLDGVEGNAAARVRADLLGLYGWFCQEAGHHIRAIDWSTRAIAEAEAAGELPALAEALRVSDWAKMQLGRLGEPDDTVRALAIYEELGDLHGQSSITNLLGVFAYWRGDWPAALDYYDRSLVLAKRAGNPIKVAFQQYNICEIYVDQGRFDEAGPLLDDAEREWRGAGYRAGVASAWALQARVAGGRGEFAEAQRLFGDALAEFRAIGSQADLLETESRLAECLVCSGDVDAALAGADAAIAQARSLGGVSAQLPLLHRVRGAALARTGDRSGARVALADSLDAARRREAEHDMALTLRALAGLARSDGDADADADAIEREADAVLSRLDVAWTLDLLAGDGQPPRVAVIAAG